MVTALGLAGIPFSGSDVGGFIGDPGPELYIRWLQAAAFHPFFRSHTSLFDPDQEPWSYGEPYTTIARDTIRLRYTLLPYIYTLAWEASRKGWPLVRPLFWGEVGGVGGTGEGSPAGGLPGADDSFLLGDSLLVAPVTEPGATSREVPVPPGLWYDYWTDTPIEGPATVRLEAPLDRLPLLVRAGTVLPAEDPAQSTSARRMDRLYLHLYPPAQAGETALRLYSDSGDGAGPYRLDDFILRQGAGGLELEWAPVSGDSCFPWPYGEVVLIAHPGPGKASGTGDDGRALAERVTAKRPGRFRFTPEPGGSVG
jgi:alpha-glucosidase